MLPEHVLMRAPILQTTPPTVSKNWVQVTFLGVDLPEMRPPLLPFIRFGPFPTFWRFRVDRDWMELPLYIRLLTFLDLPFVIFVMCAFLRNDRRDVPRRC